jgi:hypothetical protein
MEFATRVFNPTIQYFFIELLNENNGEIKRAYKKQNRKLKLKIKSTVGAVFDSLSLDRLTDLMEKKKQEKNETTTFQTKKEFKINFKILIIK